MTRTTILCAAAGACLSGLAAAGPAAGGEYEDLCVMGLALGKDIKTDCSVSETINGRTYCFGNEVAKQIFMKDPEGNLVKAEVYYASKRQQ
jgi:YHS domain-containing protein